MKVLAAIFVGLLAVNASFQSPVQDTTAKDLIADVLNLVLNETSKLLTGANKIVDDWESNEDQIRQEIVDVADKAVNSINKWILKEVDTLGDGATADGKAVIACIDAEEPKTEAAILKIITDIATCAHTETPDVIAEVRTILGQLGTLQKDVQDETDSLAACTDSDANCLTMFGLSVVDTISKIPDVVKQDVKDIEALVQKIITTFQGCQIFQEIHTQAQDIFNEGVVCIKS